MIALAPALAAMGLILWPGRNGSAHRLKRLSAPSASREPARINPIRLVAAGAGLAVVVLAPGPGGLIGGLLLGAALDRLLRRLESGAQRRLRRERERELPVALDLLAVALRAGMPMSGAADLVAGALSGPLAEDLRRVGAAGALGADATSAWAHVADDPLWTEVVRSVARAADSGSALSGLLRRVAEDRRVEQEQGAHAAAQKASVIAMAPLGLCFLPAFVCIGVVPVVIGLLSHALA